MKKLLFVCVENACRSQLAEAFARIHGHGIVEAYSSGSQPSGEVNPRAISAMLELGYDMTGHCSKSLDDLPQIEYDYVVTMGCGDSCPHIAAKNRLDWQIPDPKHMNRDAFNEIRDLVADQVVALIDEIRESSEQRQPSDTAA